MSEYWMGVLSVPALVLAIAAGWLAMKAVGKVGERLLVGGLMVLGMTAPLTRRTATAAVVYGAKRSYMLAGGDVALLLVVGMDGERVGTAAKRLEPLPLALRDFTKPAAQSPTPPITDQRGASHE